MKKSIPLYIHPDMVARHFAVDHATGATLGDEALAPLLHAARMARQATLDIETTHAKIMQNPMQTQLRNQQQSRATAWRRVEATTKLMDAALDRAHRSISELQSSMALPKAKDAMTAIAHSDIRRALSAMNSADRNATVQRAIENADTDILAAIFGLTSFASGIQKHEAELILVNWNRRHHAEKLDRIERLERASADVLKMGQGLQAWANGLTDGDAIRKAEASERAANYI